MREQKRGIIFQTSKAFAVQYPVLKEGIPLPGVSAQQAGSSNRASPGGALGSGGKQASVNGSMDGRQASSSSPRRSPKRPTSKEELEWARVCE
eukprot:2305485-Rhodomonas_salina.2